MTKTGITVSFRSMDQGTDADYQLLDDLEKQHLAKLPERILLALEKLDDGLQSYQVSRLQHSLQAASRAEDNGADIELIVAALIHDLGDELAPQNHSQFAAAIIRPYVRAEVAWIVEKHGVFQMYYYADKLGQNKDARESYRDHMWFDACEKFCALWDQVSFDPNYPTRPLSHFAPLVHQIFTRPPFDPNIIGGVSPVGEKNFLNDL